MIRVLASFVGGLLFGAGGLFLAGRLFLLIVEGSDATAAQERNMSLPAYQAYVDLRYERPFLLFALVGGLMCAWWCAHAAWRSEVTAPRPTARRRRHAESDDPLTRDE